MKLRRRDTPRYIIAVIIILVAFLLLGGANWIKGMHGGGGSSGMGNLQWTQILIGLGLGFLIGYLFGRRR